MNDRIELDGYLGEAKSELLAKRGGDGYEQMLRVSREIEELLPEDDDVAARLHAHNGAVQMALGDETLESLGERLDRLRAAEREAEEALRGAILWAAEEGVPQTQIAERAKITRRAVRVALGLRVVR